MWVSHNFFPRKTLWDTGKFDLPQSNDSTEWNPEKGMDEASWEVAQDLNEIRTKWVIV